MLAIKVDNLWIEEPEAVKQEVKRYFEKTFMEESWDRPTLDGIFFSAAVLVSN